MKRLSAARVRADESGAALVLAIAFLVVIGVICSATLASITSSLHNRQSLDAARDREYAADGGIEYAIAEVRPIGGQGPALAAAQNDCTPTTHAFDFSVGANAIHVNCTNVPTTTYTGFVQRNVIFTACAGTSDCTDATAIVRAQVNYQALNNVVTGTTIQSWSVLS